MRNTAYDLFKGTSRGNAELIGTVEGLQAAADRMGCLALSAPDDYFLVHSGNIVASVTNPRAHQAETSSVVTIVIISSDSNHLTALTEMLQRQELQPLSTTTVSQFRDLLSKQRVVLAFCDDKLNDGDFRDVIKAARFTGSQARVVVTSRNDRWPEFLEAMRAGAFDVISKPCRPKDVEWMVIQAKRDDRRMANELLTSDVRIKARRASV